MHACEQSTLALYVTRYGTHLPYDTPGMIHDKFLEDGKFL